MQARRLILRAGLTVALLGATLSAGAMPNSVSSATGQSLRGLFPKIHLPRVNLGKGAKAVLYPVVKTAGNGGKAVVHGGKDVVNSGKVVIKGAKTGVELYEAGRALNSKAGGITGMPPLR